MGVYRFEDLRVWQAAMRQCDRVGELIRRETFRSDRELSDQMNAASISVANNIAEGFLRRKDREFSQHLRYSAASNEEVRTCLHLAIGRGYLTQTEAERLIEESNIIGRMLRRLMATLKV